MRLKLPLQTTAVVSTESKEDKETLIDIDRTLSQLRNHSLTTLDLSHARRIDEKKAPELKCTLEAHGARISAMTVLKDGSLVSGAGDNTIKHWDINTGKCITTLTFGAKYDPNNTGTNNGACALAELPDGTLVSGHWYGSLKHWNLKTGECLATLSEHTGMVNALVALADGNVVSGSAKDGTIKCWDLKNGLCLATLHTNCSPVDLFVLSDGSFICADGYQITRWDLNKDVCLARFRYDQGHHGGFIARMPLFDDTLISITRDGTLNRWDLKNGKSLTTLNLKSIVTSYYYTCAAALTEDSIIIRNHDDALTRWDLKTGAFFSISDDKHKGAHSLMSLPDNSFVSACDGGKPTIRHWHFPKRYLTPTEVITLLKGLKINCSVTHLNLCNVVLEEKIIPLLLELVTYHPSLTYVDLRNTHLTLAQLDPVIAAAKKRTKKLEVLCGWVSTEIAPLPGPLSESQYSKVLVESSKLPLIPPQLTKPKMETKESRGTLIDIDIMLNKLRTDAIYNLDIAHASRIDEKETLQLVNTLEGHTDTVSALMAVTDGSLVSGSYDFTIKHWDPKTAACLATFKGHGAVVRILVELADGNLVSCSSTDATIKYWNLKTGVCLSTFNTKSSNVYAIAALPDGSLATCAYSDKTIKRWNVKSGVCLSTLSGHSDTVCGLAMLPNGNLVSSSSDKTIKQWDLKTGVCLSTLDAGTAGNLKILTDGSLLALMDSHYLMCWNVNTNTKLRHFAFQGFNPNSSAGFITQLADGTVVSGNLNTIQRWDTKSGACLGATVIPLPVGWHYKQHYDVALATLPDDSVVSSLADKTIKRWHFPQRSLTLIEIITLLQGMKTNRSVTYLNLRDIPLKERAEEMVLPILLDIVMHHPTLTCLDLRGTHLTIAQLDLLITAAKKRMTKLEVLCDESQYPAAIINLLKNHLPVPTEPIKAATENKDDKELCLDISMTLNQLRTHNLTTLELRHVYCIDDKQELELDRTFSGPIYNRVHAMTTLADGTLVTGSADFTIKHWDPKTGAYLSTLRGHVGTIYTLLALADGGLLSTSQDKTIKHWDVKSGICLSTREVGWDVRALAVLGDGSLSLNGVKTPWDKLGKALAGFSNLGGCGFAVLTDGSFVRSSFDQLDQTITHWDSRYSDYHPRKTFTGHTDIVYALVALPDGNFISGSYDTTIKRWDTKSGTCLATLSGHSGGIYALALLPDGSLVSGSRDTTIKHWDIKTGKCLTTLNEHSNIVSALTIAADGSLVSCSWDNTVKFWKFSAKKRPLQLAEIISLLVEMKNNRSITSLNLSGITLEEKVLSILLELVTHHPGLTQLDLRNTGLTTAQLDPLIALAKNRVLKLQLLHDAPVEVVNSLPETHVTGALSPVKRLPLVSQQTRIAPVPVDKSKEQKKADKKDDLPFEDAHGNQGLIQNWILQGERDEIPDDCSKKIASLIRFCWQQKPDRRPSADQIVMYLRSDKEEFSYNTDMPPSANSAESSYQANLDSGVRTVDHTDASCLGNFDSSLRL